MFHFRVPQYLLRGTESNHKITHVDSWQHNQDTCGTPVKYKYDKIMVLTLKEPYIVRDPDNFTPANPLVIPVHIQPESYFLFAYAIL
jgi:hypothetical protein